MSVYFFKVPFGVSGDKAAVPRPTQVDGSVNFTDGWGIDYQLDPDSEPTARDIPRDQFNQLMYLMTQVLNQYQTQAFPDFITTSDNDGSPYEYAINATVRYTNGWAGSGAMNYYSLVDTNTANPTDATKWGLVQYSNPEVVGVVKEYYGSTLPAAGGYLWANGQTIGDASSGGTARANADTIQLFTLLWNSISNTVLPIQTSGGATSTRGVSAAVDFAAHKRLPLPNRAGNAGVGQDNMGGITARGLITTAGCGIDGSVLGAAGGDQNVALSGNQNGVHNHSAATATDGLHYHPGTTNGVGDHQHTIAGYNLGNSLLGPFPATTAANTPFNNLTNPAGAHSHTFNTDNAGIHNHGVTVDNSGSGAAHLNVQPTIIANYIIALGTV